MSLFQHERDGNVQELIRLLRESGTERIRERAAEALGNFPDHEDRRDAERALIEAARNGDDAVAAAAVDALEELGQDALESLLVAEAGIDVEDVETVPVEVFARSLSHDRPELRMAAANAIGDRDDPSVLEGLLSACDDPDPRVRVRVARAAGELGDESAIEPLAELLRDRSLRVRRAAARALGHVGTQRALSALLALAEAEDERLRRIAVDAFGNFENDEPVPVLTAALSDDVATVRRTAVYSLVELLGNVPTDRSHDIRERVVSEIAAIDDPVVLEPLVEILEDSDTARHRRNTAWFLGRVADDFEHRRVVGALADAIDDDDELLRQVAAGSLRQLGGDVVVDHLLDVATDGNARTDARTRAIAVLGAIGGDEARRRLDELIDEADEEIVQERAFGAVSRLGGRVDDEPRDS